MLGEHDCFRVACQVVHALTGVDRWPEFAGYKTRREAMIKLAQFGSTFEAAGDKFFGERIELNYARRGDIAAVQPDPAGDKHLAVVVGATVRGLSESGLVTLPLRTALCCWKVG